MDDHHGESQAVPGSDGIWDTPLVIDENNQDNYPLVSRYDYWSNPITGDINKDMKVDEEDLFQIAIAYGSNAEKQNWNPNCDLNGDNIVDASDLSALGKNFGETHTPVNSSQIAASSLIMVISILALALGKRKSPRKLTI